MKYAYSNEQMRRFDEAAIAAGTPSLTLMERAGEALARAVKEALARTEGGDALFVCGGGNNGGDGFVAARILHEAGEDVAALCIAEKFSEDCAAVRAKYRGEVLGRMPRRRYAVVVDCLFGTGLSRPAEGEDAALIGWMNACGAYVIACDIPSGLSSGGVALGPCVCADETVTMGQLKECLILSDGADNAGKVTVADIGIAGDESGAEIWEDADVKAFFSKRRSNTHKGTYGSACILAGGAYSGASFLAAGACLKSGAGYTKLCVTGELYSHAIGKLPAAILREVKALDGDILASDAIAVGMGSGVSERLYVYIAELLTNYTGTLVLDADALNTISAYGTELLAKHACRVILTPHPKEFSRLTERPVKEILSDPVGAAQAFARRYGVTVLLKNNRSVIADGTRVAVNPTGSPALAKGGSGDVLSGLLAGTCARGIAPFEAACVASYLLGRAGEIAAEEMGEYAPDPSDIIARLAKAQCSL